jgi:radical SAM superfamily enzyme YgiQ (UPF0313 family)
MQKMSLYKKGYILRASVQTGRGCPYSCKFCSVSEVFGTKYRYRPIQDVVDEIKAFGSKWVFLSDDNIVSNIKWSKELFKALIPLKIHWIAQASSIMASDDELLELMAKSGCAGVFIGFESLSAKNLESIGKGVNKSEKFAAQIKKIQSYGIALMGAFIIGFEDDAKEDFEELVNFTSKIKLESIHYAILTPLPGTKMYKEMDEAGMIIDKDWSKYDCDHVVIKHKNFEREELQALYYSMWNKSYKISQIFYRLMPLTFRLLFKRRGLFSFTSALKRLVFIWVINFAYHHEAKRVGSSIKSVRPTSQKSFN